MIDMQSAKERAMSIEDIVLNVKAIKGELYAMALMTCFNTMNMAILNTAIARGHDGAMKASADLASAICGSTVRLLVAHTGQDEDAVGVEMRATVGQMLAQQRRIYEKKG